MKFLSFLSTMMIPLILFCVVGHGLLEKRDIYSDFLEGAKDGLKIVAGLIPTLIGLMTGVGVLRASGFLDFLGGLLGRVTAAAGISPEIVPLALVRLFSSSAAYGLLLDIFKEFGTDSRAGLTASLLLSSTESVFYCMSVYFGSVGVRKTRYTLAGALAATVAGILASIWLAGFLP